MRSLVSVFQTDYEILRSRFRAILTPTCDPQAARDLLRNLKAEYADASHVVHAFRVGATPSETFGCSDDGEPSGTAGRPVLEVLKGESGGTNALLTVIRWFGGTKLGTGGLARAYAEAARRAVTGAIWQEPRPVLRLRLQVEHALIGTVHHVLEQAGTILDTEWGPSSVLVIADVFEDRQAEVMNAIRDVSRGQAVIGVDQPN